MKIGKERAAVIAAEQKLRLAKTNYQNDARLLEATIKRQRPLLLIGGGLLAGAIAGRLPLIRLAQTAVSTFSIGASLARTPLGAMLLGAFVAKQQSDENAPNKD